MTRKTERVHFRYIIMPCCGTHLCYVNPRLPTYCSECGARVYPDVKGCVTQSDEQAILQVRYAD